LRRVDGCCNHDGHPGHDNQKAERCVKRSGPDCRLPAEIRPHASAALAAGGAGEPTRRLISHREPSAVEHVWALWPIQGFRRVAIGINALMIAATPMIGAHYIIDIVETAVVAARLVLLAQHFCRL